MATHDWTRDELILALDLYFSSPAARGNKAHPAVLDLSELLNRLPIHPRQEREDYFRNPNGVAMKLSNFLRFDPSYEGSGLQRGGRLEEEIWQAFGHDLPRLRRVAGAIREAAESGLGYDVEHPHHEDTEAEEGALLSRIHYGRERSRKLVKRKKAQVLKLTGRLACEVCAFDFELAYGSRGTGFAECHHLVPVAHLAPRQRTRLSDLAILCANCHRMIHRRRPWLKLDELRMLRFERGEGEDAI